MTSIINASVAASLLACVSGVVLVQPASASPIVEYDFSGELVVYSDGGLLRPDKGGSGRDLVSGFLRYDAGTVATSPGVWNLPGAEFRAAIGPYVFQASGATARTGVSSLLFTTTGPVSGFPFAVSSATLNLGFQTFIDNYFSPTVLPTTVPPGDKTLSLSFTTVSGVSGSLSTDTVLTVTATLVPVPEAMSLALLSTGLAGLILARRRMLD